MVKIIASQDKKIPPGARLAMINDQPVDDFLEFEFYNDTSKSRSVLIEYNGTARRVMYHAREKIAITLETPGYRQCENDCHFCFINGLPGSLRKELYFRDDDYRLSFLFGNFLSLTNVDRPEISRVGRLRLSPLYVSVHTTDPVLRTRLFKNEKAGLINERLKALADENIKMHCQIVVMPGMTDGRSLTRTIDDLSRLHPAVTSIGVVPVGKTRYAKGVRLVSREQSRSIIRTVRALHDRFRRKTGRGFVYLADEFFVKAGLPMPQREYYDDFPQYENGIGMARRLLEEIKSIKKIRKTKGKYLVLTGDAACSFLQCLKAQLESKIDVDIESVANRFFGRSVTVSGLICGQDLNRAIAQHGRQYDRVILPPNCVNDDKQFLDCRKISARHAIIAPETIRELVRCLQ
ncbi:DUF512 domain-containing protein [candidate division WOR-3 bacterium]|nr:DUF512 domain-containing protein [candidate division WOR-3 bacterium]